jgi:hypothetical protein
VYAFRTDSPHHSRAYKEITKDLKGSESVVFSLAVPDALRAALAVRHDCVLTTFDTGFRRYNGLNRNGSTQRIFPCEGSKSAEIIVGCVKDRVVFQTDSGKMGVGCKVSAGPVVQYQGFENLTVVAARINDTGHSCFHP